MLATFDFLALLIPVELVLWWMGEMRLQMHEWGNSKWPDHTGRALEALAVKSSGKAHRGDHVMWCQPETEHNGRTEETLCCFMLVSATEKQGILTEFWWENGLFFFLIWGTKCRCHEILMDAPSEAPVQVSNLMTSRHWQALPFRMLLTAFFRDWAVQEDAAASSSDWRHIAADLNLQHRLMSGKETLSWFTFVSSGGLGIRQVELSTPARGLGVLFVLFVEVLSAPWTYGFPQRPNGSLWLIAYWHI